MRGARSLVVNVRSHDLLFATNRVGLGAFRVAIWRVRLLLLQGYLGGLDFVLKFLEAIDGKGMSEIVLSIDKCGRPVHLLELRVEELGIFFGNEPDVVLVQTCRLIH